MNVWQVGKSHGWVYGIEHRKLNVLKGSKWIQASQDKIIVSIVFPMSWCSNKSESSKSVLETIVLLGLLRCIQGKALYEWQ